MRLRCHNYHNFYNCIICANKRSCSCCQLGSIFVVVFLLFFFKTVTSVPNRGPSATSKVLPSYSRVFCNGKFLMTSGLGPPSSLTCVMCVHVRMQVCVHVRMTVCVRVCMCIYVWLYVRCQSNVTIAPCVHRRRSI